MLAKSGVLYLTSRPGIAKSAIIKHIADTMGYQFFDIRLSMHEETDMMFPYLQENNNGKIMKFAIPEWAIKANEKPSIINFEELNRAQQQTRNAALQILLERGIGYDFKFNDNVLMVASGNLGDKDNTDVNDFDSALINRLIYMEHDLTVKEWLEWAEKDNHIHPIICSYMKISEGINFYTNPNISSDLPSYATPRSWTFLSDYIITNYGYNSAVQDFYDDLVDIAHCYIGNASIDFLKYLDNLKRISIHDILNNFNSIKSILDEFKKSGDTTKFTELLEQLKEINVKDLTYDNGVNINKFLDYVNEEQALSYIYSIINKQALDAKNTEMIRTLKKIISGREELLKKISNTIDGKNTTLK